MSVGSNNLQEMENVVTKGAAKADAMPSLTGTTPGQTGSYEDLGGPTPQNYKVDDDSAKLKTPGTTLKQVKDIVNKGAKPADPMPAGMKEEDQVEGDVVAEDEVVTDEVVSEEETTTDEVVSEEETTETEEEVVAEEEETVEYSLEDDINALVEGEDLSEEFKEKAATIFEAAINSKVAGIKEELTASYEEKLVEEVASIKEELKDRVDSYLEYVADEWIAENQLAVESGLKEEMTESFISGMKSLFEEHYVTIPEDKYDVIESMVDKLDEMEGKLNEQIEKNVALNKRLAESVSDVVFAEVTEGLAQTQKDKLAGLVDNVEFESETAYREKLETLKESYFPTKVAQRNQAENLTEEAGSTDYTGSVSPSMEAYLKTLTRVSKK
jgi:hypothetical protein|tara:strand:+ start:14379 stop:15530 length:1152 start_codon:yes stop_codon:yes gene_type:complete